MKELRLFAVDVLLMVPLYALADVCGLHGWRALVVITASVVVGRASLAVCIARNAR